MRREASCTRSGSKALSTNGRQGSAKYVDLCAQNAGKLQALFPRAIERILVARIGVAHHAAGRVVPQHTFEPARGIRGPIGHGT